MRRIVHGDGLIYLGSDVVTIFLQLVESILNGLIDGFFNVATNVIDLIDATNALVGIGDVDGGHVKTGAVKPRSLA